MDTELPKYRITTDGMAFRVEILQSADVGWVMKKWVQWYEPCDSVMGAAVDDMGFPMPEEIVEYPTLKAAQDALVKWTTSPSQQRPVWTPVWP